MVRVSKYVRLTAVLAAFAGGQASAGAIDVSQPEFPVENAALIAATEAYFDAVEGSDAPREPKSAPVIGLPLAATKASITTPESATDPLRRNGPVRHLTGYNITWYPLEHLMGSVDFMGTWDGNRNLVCGYVTWDLTDPEAPVLTEVHASFLDMADLARLGDDEVHAALLDANCAFGAIDANYSFFEVAG